MEIDPILAALSEAQGNGALDKEDEDKVQPVRLTTLLHMPWPLGDPMPYTKGGKDLPKSMAMGYVRPSIFRTYLVSRPIDRVAARVTKDFDKHFCPYCRDSFRNPAALKLHVEERHAAEFTEVVADTEVNLFIKIDKAITALEQLGVQEQQEQRQEEEYFKWL